MNLKQRAEEIRKLNKTTIESIIRIGHHLIEAKKEINHGNWVNWLQDEFSWVERTARRFMQIAQMIPLSKTDKMSDLKDIKPTELHHLMIGTTKKQRQEISKSLSKKKLTMEGLKKKLAALPKKKPAKKLWDSEKDKIKVSDARMAISTLIEFLEDELPKLKNFKNADDVEQKEVDKLERLLRQALEIITKTTPVFRVVKGGKL